MSLTFYVPLGMTVALDDHSTAPDPPAPPVGEVIAVNAARNTRR